MILMTSIVTLKTYHQNESSACYDGRTQGYAVEAAHFIEYLFSGGRVAIPTEERDIAVFDDQIVIPINGDHYVNSGDLVEPIIQSIVCGDTNPSSLVIVPHNLNLIP